MVYSRAFGTDHNGCFKVVDLGFVPKDVCNLGISRLVLDRSSIHRHVVIWQLSCRCSHLHPGWNVLGTGHPGPLWEQALVIHPSINRRILTDVILLAMPLPMLKTLHVPRVPKSGLARLSMLGGV